MNERVNGLIIYIIKCAIGTITIFTVSSLIHYNNIAWSLISVLLVLSPEGKDAIGLAINRIKANVIGAATGLLCLLIYFPNMWMISVAIALTLIVCHFLNLDSAARSALAATVIIMLRQEGTHLWTTAIERVIAVFVGCILGLIITFVFHLSYRHAKNTKTSIGSAES
jgi:uncharacterized membrane protein YgaE (UPF0421/DUF939 family)